MIGKCILISFEYKVYFNGANKSFLDELAKSDLAVTQSDTFVYLKDSDIESGWSYDITVLNFKSDDSTYHMEIITFSLKLFNLLNSCLSKHEYHIQEDGDEELITLSDIFRSV